MANEQTIDHLIATLRDGWSHAFTEAIETLEQIGQPAVERLIASLDDDNGSLREGAVAALGRITDGRALDPIVNRLHKDPRFEVRDAAVYALGRFGARGVQPLGAALKDNDAAIRMTTAQVLGQIGDPAAIAALIGALNDKADDVREWAAVALGRIGDPRATDDLLRLLEDDGRNEVRSSAARALGRIGDSRALESLVQVLDDESMTAYGRKVSWMAAVALGLLNDEAADAPLFDRMDSPDWVFRQHAATALIKIDGPHANDGLKALMADQHSDEADISAAAREALRSLGYDPVA